MGNAHYEIDFEHEAIAHLAALTARDRAIVVDAIEDQLRQRPTFETRNRKRMRPNPIGTWVLRVGALRVYYDVRSKPPAVTVRAIGVKLRNRVTIGGIEVEL